MRGRAYAGWVMSNLGPLGRATALAVAAALLPAYVASAPASASAYEQVTAAVTRSLIDTDGDGIDDTRDGCPTVAARTSTGCPLASRKVSLKWLPGKQRLRVRVGSPVAGCAQRARIAVFRVRPNRDFKVFGGNVSSNGRLRIKVARGATYYVTVPTSYASGIAECGAATSRKVLAVRG